MTIVVAYADTAPGRAALDTAFAEAARRQESVVLVPAVREASTPDLTVLRESHSQRWDQLDQAGVEVSVRRPDLADPSDRVVQVAQRVGASLVVLGLRQRSPVGKMLLGSTAQRILLDATCPVLAVKAARAGDW